MPGCETDMMRTLRNNRGFSLIEVLVVMAISVILVGLVLAPLAQSFRMTRQAQAMADAQDSARQAMELISRDLGEAMFVFDNARVPVSIFEDGATPDELYNTVTGNQEGPIVLPVRQPGDQIACFVLPYGKIDFVLPKINMHCNNPEHPSGSSRDYPRGDEAWPPCPVCQSTNVDARPKFPLEQDTTVVRYFLGLRYNNPAKWPGSTVTSDLAHGEGIFGWKSPYDGELEPDEENQVVLYRVEFDPYDNTLFPAGMPVSERLSDPIFFYRLAANSEGRPCCEAWAERARVIGMGKYQDLVVARYANDDPNDNVLGVQPSTSFRFGAIENDTFSAAYSNDRGFDYPDTVPTVYRSTYGYWSNADAVTVYRYRTDDDGDEITDAFTTEYVTVGGASHLMIIRRSSEDNWASTRQEFDITQYLTDLENGNLTQLTRPGSSEPPEMAFWLDYVTMPGSPKTVAFSLSRGNVHFQMTPPKLSGGKLGPVIALSPARINADRRAVVNAGKRSATPRMASLGLTPGARIVPGSEKVVGPDMTPGGVASRIVQYQRVPLAMGDPEINQYKIDYDSGDLYFTSDPGHDLPEVTAGPGGGGGPIPILVDYNIQFNAQDDVVKGDYTTKSLVTVHLGMRMYDPDEGKPHSVDLTNSIKVRNARR